MRRKSYRVILKKLNENQLCLLLVKGERLRLKPVELLYQRSFPYILKDWITFTRLHIAELVLLHKSK